MEVIESYTVPEYIGYCIEANKKLGKYPITFCKKYLGITLGLEAKAADNLAIGSLIKYIARPLDVKPFTMVKKFGDMYLTAAAVADLVAYADQMGVSTYIARREDFRDQETGMYNGGISFVDQLSQMQELQIELGGGPPFEPSKATDILSDGEYDKMAEEHDKSGTFSNPLSVIDDECGPAAYFDIPDA